MSADAFAWVFRHSPFTGAALNVHLAIGDSVNDQNDNELWLTKEKLAMKARVSASTAKSSVSLMLNDGLLEELEPSKGRRPARYRFLQPDIPVVYESRRKRSASEPPTGQPPAGSTGQPPAGCPPRTGQPPAGSQPSTSQSGNPQPANLATKRSTHKVEINPRKATQVPQTRVQRPVDALTLVPDEVRPAQAPGAPPEAERLCHLLADLIEANGSKRPAVTKSWYIECDRLIRIDGRTPEQIEWAIRWSQSDSFWRTNVLSMPTLRQRFDRLRLEAARQESPRRDSSWDRSVAAGRAWLERTEGTDVAP